MSELVLLVESGTQVYREYLLRTLAADRPVWLFSATEPSWERPYLVGHTTVDTADAEAMAVPARRLRPAGVLTWYETCAVPAARLAGTLGLPGCAPQAALRCRDKHATRAALAAAVVPQAASALVSSLAEARAAAARIGYPVVLKARALNASIGVVLVEEPGQLAARFRIARGATSPGATEVPPGDVLVEEYLSGPEVSIDAAWYAGVMTMAFVARKETGFPPYFEETGHLVDGDDPLLTDARLAALLADAHAAVGFDTGWTHTEVRLTAGGPKVVEINPRIGGDLIPYLGGLALGVHAAPVAATVACGRSPVVEPSHRRVAAVRFVYPDRDTIVRAVHIDADRLPSTVVDAVAVALPGQHLALPPAGHVSSRYAAVAVVADTAERCRADLTAAVGAVRLESLD